jgi:hypothetical protein
MGAGAFVQWLKSLYCSKQVNFTKENTDFTYFNLKLDESNIKLVALLA